MSNNNSYTPSTPDWAKPYLDKAAQIYGIPTLLLSAQLEQESGFKQKARGHNRDQMGNILSTDRGIAQINSFWHPEITDEQADNPAFAIDWMARTMSEKMGRYGDWGKALSEYNTGNPTKGFANGYVQRVADRAGVPVAQAQTPIRNSNLLASATPGSPSGYQSVEPKQPTEYQSTQPSPPSPYTVKKGDTLWDLAKRFLGSGARWKELGFQGDPRKMPIGTQIVVPGQQLTFRAPMTPAVPYTPAQPVYNPSPRPYTPAPAVNMPTPPTPPAQQPASPKPYIAPGNNQYPAPTSGWA